MFELTRTLWICSARRPTDSGAATYGHNFRVRVTVGSRELDEDGRVLDPERLRAAAWEILQPLDHQVLDEVAPFDRMRPTTERLAAFVGEELSRRLEDGRVRVRRVEIREREDDTVVWTPDL